LKAAGEDNMKTEELSLEEFICLEAIKRFRQWSKSFYYDKSDGKIYKSDKEFKDALEKFKTDKFYIEAVRRNARTIVFLPESVKTRALCFAAVMRNGRALQYVPEKLRDEIMYMSAVKTYGPALKYIPEYIKVRGFYRAAVERNGLLLKYVPGKLKTEELCLEAVAENLDAFEYVPKTFITEEFCFKVIKQWMIRYLRYNDTDICPLSDVLEYVPKEFKRATIELGIKTTENISNALNMYLKTFPYK